MNLKEKLAVFRNIDTFTAGIAITIVLIYALLLAVLSTTAAILSFLSAFFMVLFLLVVWSKGTGHNLLTRVSSIFIIFMAILVLVAGFNIYVSISLGALLKTIYIVALTVTFFYTLLVIPLAIYSKIEEEKEVGGLRLDRYPYVSILVPAHNEENTIEGTIDSLIETSYPHKEIIVIDDGSEDDTYSVASKYVPQITLLSKKNGGKSSAINYGLLFSKGEIIVTVDADCIVGFNSIEELVRRFRNDSIMAVAGNIKVLNRENLLTKAQALEYIVSINIIRRALDLFGAVTVIPGALGAIRRKVIEGSGGYDNDTLTEDYDMTTKTLKTGKIVQSSSFAISYTVAPDNMRDFYKQRKRWYRGNTQGIFKHIDALSNYRYGNLYELSHPFSVLSMLMMPLFGIVVISSAIYLALTGAFFFVFAVFLIFSTLQILISVLALHFEDEDMSLALLAPLFVIGYKQLCDLIIIKSMVDVFSGRKLDWSYVESKGKSFDVM